MKARISELFYSIQGEGLYAGIPMAFVRFSYCPWRCRWCDSVYTWAWDPETLKGLNEPDGVRVHEALEAAKFAFEMEVPAIVQKIEAFQSEWVCLTGGEPLAQPAAFNELALSLKSIGKKLEVETSGLNPLPITDEVFKAVDCWVVDVKCPSSEMEARNKLDGLVHLRECDQVKFVVSDNRDLEFALHIYETHLKSSLCHVLISPAVTTRFYSTSLGLQDVAEFVKEAMKSSRLSLQIHKFIWGEQRGV